jgi:hypothetical protein
MFLNQLSFSYLAVDIFVVRSKGNLVGRSERDNLVNMVGNSLIKVGLVSLVSSSVWRVLERL